MRQILDSSFSVDTTRAVGFNCFIVNTDLFADFLAEVAFDDLISVNYLSVITIELYRSQWILRPKLLLRQ